MSERGSSPPAPLRHDSAQGIHSHARIALFAIWHVLTVAGAILYVPGWPELALTAGMYALGMFAVTAGYHRYFSHRSFKTSRPGQLVLAWCAESTMQKGVLWWAAHHRAHHASSDDEGDPHSPLQGGAIHAHAGWLFRRGRAGRDESRVPDLVAVPELRFLDRAYMLPPAALMAAMWLVGGTNAVVWGFAVPILAVQHATLSINSLAHIWGTRVYDTADGSRNNALLALLTFGEGWHNNHHHYPGSARQGFLWWQLDPTWYALRALASVGLVWDLREPPPRTMATPGP